METINNPFYRECKMCGKRFTATHGNQQFCPERQKLFDSDFLRNCKITYNNLIAKSKRDATKKYSSIQHKNWKGLNSLFKEGKQTYSLKDIKDAGIDINYSVKTLKLKNTTTLVKCFLEYGLIMINENEFKIIKHEIQL